MCRMRETLGSGIGWVKAAPAALCSPASRIVGYQRRGSMCVHPRPMAGLLLSLQNGSPTPPFPRPGQLASRLPVNTPDRVRLTQWPSQVVPWVHVLPWGPVALSDTLVCCIRRERRVRKQVVLGPPSGIAYTPLKSLWCRCVWDLQGSKIHKGPKGRGERSTRALLFSELAPTSTAYTIPGLCSGSN